MGAGCPPAGGEARAAFSRSGRRASQAPTTVRRALISSADADCPLRRKLTIGPPKRVLRIGMAAMQVQLRERGSANLRPIESPRAVNGTANFSSQKDRVQIRRSIFRIDASFSNVARRTSVIEGGAGRRLEARGTLRASEL